MGGSFNSGLRFMPLAEISRRQISSSLDQPATSPAPAPIKVAERRGPMRPKVLAPTRLRLAGRLITQLFQAGDAVALALAGWLAVAMTSQSPIEVAACVTGSLAAIATLSMLGAYSFSARQSVIHQTVMVSLAFAISVSVAVLALLAVFPAQALSTVMQIWAPTAWALLLISHTIWWSLVRRWRRNGRLTPNMVVVGATGAAARLVQAMLESHEANILGLFDDRAARSPSTVQGVPVLGDTQALLVHKIMPFVDRIVISVPSSARARVGELIERLRILPNEVTLLLERGDRDYEAAAISRLADVPLARISGPPANAGRAAVKRLQDLVFGIFALIFALPIMVVVAFAIKMDSPGPVLFRQRRHGFNNEEITVWKFRSMRVESADAQAHRQITANDERVTRVGKIIRRT